MIFLLHCSCHCLNKYTREFLSAEKETYRSEVRMEGNGGGEGHKGVSNVIQFTLENSKEFKQGRRNCCAILYKQNDVVLQSYTSLCWTTGKSAMQVGCSAERAIGSW